MTPMKLVPEVVLVIEVGADLIIALEVAVDTSHMILRAVLTSHGGVMIVGQLTLEAMGVTADQVLTVLIEERVNPLSVDFVTQFIIGLAGAQDMTNNDSSLVEKDQALLQLKRHVK